MGRRSKPLTETGGGGGKTFDIIHRTLTEALGYTVYYKIIDAQSVVPQHRERIFSC